MTLASSCYTDSMAFDAPFAGNMHQIRTVDAFDADEHAHNLTDWEQSYDQITRGRFHGTLAELQLPQMQVFRECASQAVHVDNSSRASLLQTLSGLLQDGGGCTDRDLRQQVLVNAQLALLDTRAVDSAVSGSFQRRQRIVAKARDLVLAHHDQAITVPQLCEQLFVSRRTLQYCFEDVLGMSPMQYLRLIRLNGARRHLRQASSKSLTVQDVAVDWGFWHFSQFSSDYRKLFGQSPSESLRQRSH